MARCEFGRPASHLGPPTIPYSPKRRVGYDHVSSLLALPCCSRGSGRLSHSGCDGPSTHVEGRGAVGGGADAVRDPDGTWCICYLLHHAQVTSTHLEVHPSSGCLQEHQQSASTNTLDPCEHRALQQLHFAMTKDVHRFVYMLLGVLDTSDDNGHEHEVCTGAK